MTPEDILKVEERIVSQSVGGWVSEVEALKKAVLLIIAEAPTSDMTPYVPQVLMLIDTLNIPKGMAALALEGVEEAHGIGLLMVSESLNERNLPNVAVSKNSKKAVRDLDNKAAEALKTSRAALASGLVGKGAQSLLTPLAPLLQNPAQLKRDVEWAYNNSVNSATSKLALKMNETMVWIPERDGCVHCTAYAGVRSTKVGFPDDLTYGKKPLGDGGTIPHPPLHPHCRCIVEVGITEEYAEALKRESVRSILRGYALPTESQAARIDAAKRLLNKDPVAPAAVKKFAERKIRNFTAQRAKGVTPKPVVKASDIEGKAWSAMSNPEKLKAAEIMYGRNSDEFRTARKMFR